MLVIGIFGSYQTAQAAEIVAGYTALEVIEGILLSFGISIFTTEMVSTLTEDPKTAQDEYWRETQAAHWAEYMEAVYEEERKKVVVVLDRLQHLVLLVQISPVLKK